GNIAKQAVQAIEQIVVAHQCLRRCLLDACSQRLYLLRRRRLEEFLRRSRPRYSGEIAAVLVIGKKPEDPVFANRPAGVETPLQPLIRRLEWLRDELPRPGPRRQRGKR